MSRIMIFGDFKANKVKRLNLDGALVRMLNESDINIVNFEAPVKTGHSPIHKSGPNISQDIQAPEFLEQLGFNVISLANNHLFDFGPEGFLATKDAFSKESLIGAGTENEAYKPAVIESKDGLKIGILAATHNEFGNHGALSANELGTASLLSPKFRESVRLSALDPGIDFLLIVSHAGVENVEYPLPELREIYRELIDLGADAVIASHPHIIQGLETYKDKPIAYSLGNFCFQTDKPNL